MLKHKLRKTTEKISFSRKNGERKKSNAKDVLYAKVRKTEARRALFPEHFEGGRTTADRSTSGGEGGKTDKLSTSMPDGGYFTGPESFYEVPEESGSTQSPGKQSRGVERGQEDRYQEIGSKGQQQQQQQQMQIQQQQQQLPCMLYMPIPVFWCRRATPQEDFLYSSQGIENLVIQQQKLVNNISVTMGKTDPQTPEQKSTQSSSNTNTSLEDAEHNIKVSSMTKLRRLLEIEEMKTFSEKVSTKIR